MQQCRRRRLRNQAGGSRIDFRGQCLQRKIGQMAGWDIQNDAQIGYAFAGTNIDGNASVLPGLDSARAKAQLSDRSVDPYPEGSRARAVGLPIAYCYRNDGAAKSVWLGAETQRASCVGAGVTHDRVWD